jgi:AraC family transcriptional activator of pobA
MDHYDKGWYFSCMEPTPAIPVFTLFGETDAFPDVVHSERIVDRAPAHGWTIFAHRHAQLAQLFLIETGSAEAVVDGQKVSLTDNHLLFVPPQAVHSFVFAPATTGWVQSFPMSIVSSIDPGGSDIGRVLSGPFSGPSDARLLNVMLDLDETLTQIGTFRTQAAVGLAHAILARVAEIGNIAQPPGERSTPARLKQLNGLIASHLQDDWTARDYANAMAISTGHLARLCRNYMGMSTSAYIEAAVMQEASRLLAFTQMTVTEAAYRLGFNDPSYFSRRFRAVHGVTPSDYRKQFSD